MKSIRFDRIAIVVLLFMGLHYLYGRFEAFRSASDPEPTPVFSQGDAPEADPIKQPSNDVIEQAIHNKINVYRASRNLDPLQLDYRMTNESRRFSAKMASGEASFSHDGFEQRVASLEKFEVKYSHVAENLAYLRGYDDLATTAVEGWIDSPDHHKNIIGDFDRTGIGVAFNGEGDYYFTQLFVRSPDISIPGAAAKPEVSPQTLEQIIHEKINTYRGSLDLPPLTLDARIIEESRRYSAKMASGEATFSHDGFETRAASLEQQSLRYTKVAENLALLQGYEDLAQTAVQGWLESPGHHQNIVGDFDLTGIGVVGNEEGAYYFTQLFVKLP